MLLIRKLSHIIVFFTFALSYQFTYAEENNSLTISNWNEDINSRISSLEEEVRRLTGKIEELEHLNALQSKKSDLLGTKQNIPDKQINEQHTTIPSSDDQFQAAFKALKEGNYKQAEKLFNNYIEKFPTHKHTGEAYYWLGEIYYTEKDYNKAAINFIHTVKISSNTETSINSLFKLGMSLAYLNKQEDACKAFNRLKTNYNNIPSSMLLTLEKKWEELGCS